MLVKKEMQDQSLVGRLGAKLLKNDKQWDHPDHCLNILKYSIKLILTDFEWSIVPAEISFCKIIGEVLGDSLQNTDDNDIDIT